MKKFIFYILLLSSFVSQSQVYRDAVLAESKPTVHRGWTPKDLGSKLEFWFDNNHYENITFSGGRVSTQTDETGAYTRAVASPAAMPFYNRITNLSDKGHISYEGAEGLKLSVNGFNHQQGEIFVVFRRLCNATVGLTNNQFLACSANSTNNNNYIFFSDFANSNSQGNSIGVNSNVAGTANIGYAGTKSISDKKIIANLRSDGADYFMGFDSDLSMLKTFSVSDNGDWFGDIFGVSDLFSFGYRTLSIGTAYSAHYEYDILYFNTLLSSTERTQVLNYLNTKHDCYRGISYQLGAIYHGSSNCAGQSTVLPNRLKIALPKGYIRTGTNTFAQLLFGTNNEGDGGASQYGAEMSFLAYLSEYTNTDVYIDKAGIGGSRFCVIDGSNPVSLSTNSWNTAAADLWPVLQTTTGELQTKLTALNASNKTIYFVIGGENDTFYDGDAAGMQTNLTDVIAGLNAIMTDMDFYIINRIKNELSGTGSSTPKRAIDRIYTVQAALEAVYSANLPNAILLNMVNYPTGESVHFQSFTHVLIGRDAAEYIKVKL